MARLCVEVVYALPRAQDRVALELDPGATVRDAVESSGVLARHPELDPSTLRLGLFGRRVGSAHALADGDRVELLRPLALDPKEARRRRARRRR